MIHGLFPETLGVLFANVIAIGFTLVIFAITTNPWVQAPVLVLDVVVAGTSTVWIVSKIQHGRLERRKLELEIEKLENAP